MAEKDLIKKGIFITFEGPEGSGKSTQSNLLRGFLKKKGYEVVQLREPGETKLGEIVRNILLHSKKVNITPEAEAFLYLTARTQLVKERIIPALRQGKIVICDRFADATVAYQGHGLGININMLHKFNDFATQNIKPDITFLMDLAPKTGLKRSKNMKGFKDRIEKRAIEFHEKIRAGYLDLAKNNKKRIKVLTVKNQTKQQIQAMVRREVDNVIRQKKK